MTTPDPRILFVPSLSRTPGQTEKTTPQGIAESSVSPCPPPFGGTHWNEPSDQSSRQLVPEAGTTTPCGHTHGNKTCTITGPHAITPDGRIQHYYRAPSTAHNHMAARS